MEATFAPTVKMHHATRAKAEKLIATLAAEYTNIVLVAVNGAEIDHEKYTHDLDCFEIHTVEGDCVAQYDKIPELADVLEACSEADINPEGDDEEEEARASGSVVREAYRQKYRAASSNGQTCGDWLAERMVDDTSDADGKLDVDTLTALFEANGLNMNAKWALARLTQTRGWQGRYRMSGRIVLEKEIAMSGIYSTPDGVQVAPPADWLAQVQEKHAAWIAKSLRRIEAATKSIKEAVEG